MNWQTKARIQSLVAKLPNRLSYPLYYQLQRRLGAMRPHRIDPTNRMEVGIDLCRQIVAADRSPVGATFFEVGTGWRLNLPIACWLLGAKRTVTVDLNRYLKMELVREDLAYLRTHAESIAAIFLRELPDHFDADRFESLQRMQSTSAEHFCRTLGIEYLAPTDATATSLDPDCIDFHVSCNVLEHIPASVLRGIFIEANRIVHGDGLLVHRVDHSDHFAHNDRSISQVNFLQYPDAAWDDWADNRYAYVNRLREDDYLQLFEQAGQEIRLVESLPDKRVLADLTDGLPLNERFAEKSHDTLARLHTLFVTTPSKASLAQVA